MPPDRLLSGYHAGHAEGAAIEGRSSADGGEAVLQSLCLSWSRIKWDPGALRPKAY